MVPNLRFISLYDRGTLIRVKLCLTTPPSTNLNNLFTNLENNRFFLSNAERNYGTYSVQMNNNENLYTVFFSLKNEQGRFNGIRYQLVLFVESAYFREKPKKVQNVKIATIVSKALEGEMVKKFRR